ncbi:hypothetical protein Trihar35433_10831 [Trichoderma harzianum]|nr:hypothetical protein Trihar35433_10831 [Trichoderma harzianum]
MDSLPLPLHPSFSRPDSTRLFFSRYSPVPSALCAVSPLLLRTHPSQNSYPPSGLLSASPELKSFPSPPLAVFPSFTALALLTRLSPLRLPPSSLPPTTNYTSFTASPFSVRSPTFYPSRPPEASVLTNPHLSSFHDQNTVFSNEQHQHRGHRSHTLNPTGARASEELGVESESERIRIPPEHEYDIQPS